MKKRVFILLLAVFNAAGVFAKTISSNTTFEGTDTYNESVTVNRNVTYTINGDLTVKGSFTASGATIIINGTLHVTGNYSNSYSTYWGTTYYSNTIIGENGNLIVDNTLTDDANITVNGYLKANTVTMNNNMTINDGGVVEAGSVAVNDEQLLVKGGAVLHTRGDLYIGEYGSLTLSQNSTTIVEGDLNQDGDTPLGFGLIWPNTGDINADHAKLLVGGDYIIYSTRTGRTDGNADYINPAQNPEFVVLGENDLDKIAGIDGSVLEERKAEFIATYGNDVNAYYAIVMPIELVYFEAYHYGGEVYFKWQTASELNNDYFTIECSADAVDFEQLATVQGSGTTDYTVDYDYNYRSNFVGTMYYRLKQTDYDGSSTYSKTVAVNIAAKAVKKADDFTIYPNPAVDFVTIGGGEYESVAFISSDGKIISEQAPQSLHSIDMLPKGVNIVVIRTANGTVSKNIIKQ